MTDPPPKITEFDGEYRFLSNFHPAPMEYERISYPTVEHAYQAAKTTDYHERQRIAALPSPGRAKRAGAKLTLRPDWDALRLNVMETLLRQKFTLHADLRALLLATGDAILEEGNTWGDVFWGVCNGVGENHLGKLLMKIRDELKNQPQNPAGRIG
jgi:ribA/ribD-fused uncharacterized protein